MNNAMWFGVVYVITNLANGMQYVGKAGDYEHRWNSHVAAALGGKYKHYLHRAIRKYGKKNFSIEVIQRCRTLQTLNRAEIHWIKRLKTMSPGGYNLTIGGDGVMSGRKHTKATKRLMSRAHVEWFSIPENLDVHTASLNSPEYALKQSASQRRRFAEMSKKERVEYSALCSRTQKRRYKDPAAHKAARKGQRNRFKDPEKRAANAKAHRTKEFRTRQADDSSAKWKDTKWRKKWLKSARSPEGHRMRSSAAKRWHADPEKHARQQAAANQSPEAQKKRSKTLAAWYADPKNHTKHLKTHRTKEFRAKRSKIAKAQWPKTSEERKAYWRCTHPNGNGHGQLTK